MIKKNFHLIFIAFAIIVIICGFIFSNVNSKRLLKYSKYTIAEIVSDWHHKNNTGIGVDYLYIVNNREYRFTVNIDLKKGERYLLIYDSLRPSNCRVLGIYPINNDNIVSPVNGWKYKEVPIQLSNEDIVSYIKEYK